MTLLSEAQLAAMRAQVARTFFSTCTIARPGAGTVGDDGFVSAGISTVAADVPCRLDPLRQADSQGTVAGREANTTYFTLTLAWDADIRNGDRVIVDGATLEVQQLHDVHSANVSKRATVARVGNG